MEDNIIFIKCPKCGAVLRLTDKPGLDKLHLTCPVCKEKNPYTQYVRVVKKVTPPADEDKTDIRIPAPAANKPSTSEDPTTFAVAKLVTEDGRTYELVPGVNTVGRKATTSKATLQIETLDMHMSRNHAIIEVLYKDGKQLFMFKNHENKNPNNINGKLVEDGDVIMLKDNDKISLSTVNVIFKEK